MSNGWHRARGGCVLAGVLACGVGVPADGGAPADRGRELRLSVDGATVSAELRHASLLAALHDLARQAGFKLVAPGPLDEQVSLSRSRVPLADLLETLLRGCSWVAEYHPDGAAARDRMVRLLILSTGDCSTPATAPGTAGAAAAAPRPARARAAPTERDDLKARQKALQRAINGFEHPPLDDLIAQARNDPNISIRILATMALGRIRAPEARAVLIEQLHDDNTAIRRAAVRGLARTWGIEAVDPLGAVLSHDTDPGVFSLAVDGLARIGTDAAWQRLRLAAANGDPKLRAIVQRALDASERNGQASATGQ